MKINENKASGASVVETLEMSQKPVVRPIERISAHSAVSEKTLLQGGRSGLGYREKRGTMVCSAG